MNKLEIELVESRNNEIIKEFIRKYSLNKRPIEVSFRDLLPEIKNSDRYTHLIHSYPAKLLVHIPYLFINNSIFSTRGDKVLDPFVGSGTVMLEAIIAKRNAYGSDANPLARLISEVKVSELDPINLKKHCKNIISKAKKYKKIHTPNVVNCEYWFPEKTIESLGKILTAINKIKENPVRSFMLVSFSNCVKKVSYADQRISVPVRLNPSRFPSKSAESKRIKERIASLEKLDIFKKFEQITNENIKRVDSLKIVRKKKYAAFVISKDARNLTRNLKTETPFPSNSIQLIISSPPYAGAQKYIRASSLNLGWTQLAGANELIELDNLNIGRENFKQSEIKIKKTHIIQADNLIKKIFKISPSRANIVCTYLNEMKHSLNEMIRVLKKNGYLIIIVGNNKVCNKEFNTQQYLTDYLLKKRLKLQFKLIDDIRSYGLMTKRNKTADIISREWILVFKK